jgi:hypothetical protein
MVGMLTTMAMDNARQGNLVKPKCPKPPSSHAAHPQSMPLPHSSLKKSIMALIPLEPNPCCMTS